MQPDLRPSTAPVRARFVFIDGVRGWAALVVVLYHVLHSFLGTATQAFDQVWLRFATDGALAVYVFFVLSGFALSIGFVRTRDRRQVVVSALRRYVRLTIPILCSSLLAFGLLSAGLMANQEAGVALGNTDWLGAFYTFPPRLGGMLHFALFGVFFDFHNSEIYNAVLWTMETELYGSAVVFAVLYGAGTKAWRWLVYGALGLGFFLGNSPFAAFLWGVMLAELSQTALVRGLRLSSSGTVLGGLLILVGVVKSTWLPESFNRAAELSVVAAAVVAGTVTSARLAGLFETRLSAFLGTLSFPVYVVHLPVLCSFSSGLYLALLHLGVEPAWRFPGTAVATVLVSILVALAFIPVERWSIAAARTFSDFILALPLGRFLPPSAPSAPNPLPATAGDSHP